MIRNKFSQAKCSACHSFHWAIQLDENMNPIEFKCCRCGRLIAYKPKIRINRENL